MDISEDICPPQHADRTLDLTSHQHFLPQTSVTIFLASYSLIFSGQPSREIWRLSSEPHSDPHVSHMLPSPK